MLFLPLTGWRVDLVIFNLVDVPYGGNVILFFVGIAMAFGGLKGTLRAMRNR